MPTRKTRKAASGMTFGAALRCEQLRALAAELQMVRSHPPLVKRADGKYEGDILGFVKGLRLSARVIYFLRERLSTTNLQVSWGHLLHSNDQSCSLECDIIIHTKGHIERWNGHGPDPIMEFKFIGAANARAVVSCKSQVTSIDKAYPKALKKYGIEKVFLFAECCSENRFARLRESAEKAGYLGFWCLYFAESKTSRFKTNEEMYDDFGNAVMQATRE
jgi:hypothetical protein